MPDPLQIRESWASHSPERATLLLWVTVILFIVLVGGGLTALYFYTAP